jgi:hypothetical protein
MHKIRTQSDTAGRNKPRLGPAKRCRSLPQSQTSSCQPLVNDSKERPEIYSKLKPLSAGQTQVLAICSTRGSQWRAWSLQAAQSASLHSIITSPRMIHRTLSIWPGAESGTTFAFKSKHGGQKLDQSICPRLSRLDLRFQLVVYSCPTL